MQGVRKAFLKEVQPQQARAERPSTSKIPMLKLPQEVHNKRRPGSSCGETSLPSHLRGARRGLSGCCSGSSPGPDCPLCSLVSGLVSSAVFRPDLWLSLHLRLHLRLLHLRLLRLCLLSFSFSQSLRPKTSCSITTKRSQKDQYQSK